MQRNLIGLMIAVCQLLFVPGVGKAEMKTIRISDRGQVYEIPLVGWNFKRHCGSAWCPVQDEGILAKLSQARDAYKQTLAPDMHPHRDLSRSLGKLMTAFRYKQMVNQFDQALTNVAGSYIGTALRTAVGDPTASINLVTGAIATTAAAGSEMGKMEALGVGLYFGKVAEISSGQAADFQNRYFLQTPFGWSQMKPIPLTELKTASGNAHEALRLSGPAAVLMTKVTYRDGWDTFYSFLRNTYYATAFGVYGDIFSTMDSLGSVGGGGILSVQALRAFDRAINAGRGNPFDTDIAIYREQAAKYGGSQEPSARLATTPDRSTHNRLKKGSLEEFSFKAFEIIKRESLFEYKKELIWDNRAMSYMCSHVTSQGGRSFLCKEENVSKMQEFSVSQWHKFLKEIKANNINIRNIIFVSMEKKSKTSDGVLTGKVIIKARNRDRCFSMRLDGLVKTPYGWKMKNIELVDIL